jgi:hypothetical protein
VPRIVVLHNVVELNRWIAGKEERAEAVGSVGGMNVVDLVAKDGSNAVAISADVDDVDAMLAGLASPTPDMMAAMESHGVLMPMTVYVES